VVFLSGNFIEFFATRNTDGSSFSKEYITT
jgi:hypothetical protein